MAAPSSPPVMLPPPPPPRPSSSPPTVPPPGATRRTPDGRWWRWAGRGWVPLADRNRGAGAAKAGVIVGVIQLLLVFNPLSLMGLMTGASAGGWSPGAADVLGVLVLTTPAIVLGTIALAAQPDRKVRGEAKGAIIIGTSSMFGMFAMLAMAAAS
jgi:hypothetical protein